MTPDWIVSAMRRADAAAPSGTPDGARMRARPWPARRALGDAELALLQEAIAWYRSRDEDPGYQGEFERRYCDAFAARMGGGLADAVATGTAALFVALAALDLPRGSEVIVSPITDPGTLSAIVLNGLVPRLADSAPGSYNLGPVEAAARLTERVSAVLVVHAMGQAARVDRIVAEMRPRGVRVVEDCSQAHGATLAGRPVGSFGDIAAYSTMSRKALITGGTGGVVYSRDVALMHRAMAHADRGKPRWKNGFDERDPGRFLFPALNLNLDELSCAIGLASLARLDDTIARRRDFVARLAEGLAARPTCFSLGAAGEEDSPFALPVYVDPARCRRTKIAVAEALRADGIDLNPHYRQVVSEWPWLRPWLADDFDTPRARAARDASFCLYLNENYGDAEAEDILAALYKIDRHWGTS